MNFTLEMFVKAPKGASAKDGLGKILKKSRTQVAFIFFYAWSPKIARTHRREVLPDLRVLEEVKLNVKLETTE